MPTLKADSLDRGFMKSPIFEATQRLPLSETIAPRINLRSFRDCIVEALTEPLFLSISFRPAPDVHSK